MRDAGVRFAAYALTVSDTPATAFLSSAVSIHATANTAFYNAMLDEFVAFFSVIFVTTWFSLRPRESWLFT